MSIKNSIESKLNTELTPEHLEVINESHMHNVPPGSESHFKVLAVAAQFEGKNPVQRHRAINAILSEELQNGIHALSLHAYTPQEWEKRNKQATDSPECLGGSKTN